MRARGEDSGSRSARPAFRPVREFNSNPGPTGQMTPGHRGDRVPHGATAAPAPVPGAMNATGTAAEPGSGNVATRCSRRRNRRIATFGIDQ